MSQIQELTLKIQRDLYAKSIPGRVVLNIRESWLEKLVKIYPCNIEALMLGFMFADYKLQEATELRKSEDHIRMALEYAQQSFERYDEISKDTQEIVLELIKTHHGGECNFIESKLFRNADAISALEPKCWIHLFSQMYDSKTEESFNAAFKKLDVIINDKFFLIDLNEETIAEASLLKDYYEWFKNRFST